MGREAQKCKQCGKQIYFDGLCISCQIENERKKILALPQSEIEEAIKQICKEIETTSQLEQNERLFKKLVNYRDIDTTKIAKVAFSQNLFYPYQIYKNAPHDVIQSMLTLLKKDDINSLLANDILSCLAVYGGKEVFHTFLELEKSPKMWRKNLHANPSSYATYGGWSYDKNGNFIKTIFDKCYTLKKGTLDSPIKIGIPTKEKCPSCGCEIVNIMEMDGRDSRLDFIGIDGVIQAKCCPNCFMYSDAHFCRYSINGESEILFDKGYYITQNDWDKEGIEEFSSHNYVLSKNPVPLRYTEDWDEDSSIGGFAFWIDDCNIKNCPDCGKPMKYLAQIQWDTISDCVEGTIYIEICKDCHIMAILHQQT